MGLDNEICKLKAEIQVRTIVEHAWSDIGHDRIYKSGFKVPDVWKREAARIAAELETADAAFGRLVAGIEEYHTNFGAFLTKEEIEREITVAQTVLKHVPDNRVMAVRLARLLLTQGRWEDVVEHVNSCPEPGADLLVCRGIALCTKNEEHPTSQGYKAGIQDLEQATSMEPRHVEARVELARRVNGRNKKLRLYEEAHGLDPTDPAALLGYIRQRVLEDRNTRFVPLLRPAIRAAIRKCEDRAAVMVDLPGSLYRSAALQLFLNDEAQDESEFLDALCRAAHLEQNGQMLEAELTAYRELGEVDPTRRDVICGVRFLTVARQAQFPSPTAEQDVKSLRRPRTPDIKGPVVIVAGGCDPGLADGMSAYRDLLVGGFAGFQGTVISGGTKEGVSGLVAELGETYRGPIHTIGYLPRMLPTDGSANRDLRYHEHRTTDGRDGFSAIEPLQNWIDILASGIPAREVRVLGINGGRLAALEYRIAWALGAEVAVVRGSGREADRIEKSTGTDPFPGIMVIPQDEATVRAFLRSDPDYTLVSEEDHVRLARYIHARFLDENRHKNPDSAMRPWEQLDDGLRESNLDQVVSMVSILRAVGLEVRKLSAPAPVLKLTRNEKDEMARLEHGRWNMERIRRGWRYGRERNSEAKMSPYLVGWKDLAAVDPKAPGWDEDNVNRFPMLLAEVGLEVFRTPRLKLRKTTASSLSR